MGASDHECTFGYHADRTFGTIMVQQIFMAQIVSPWAMEMSALIAKGSMTTRPSH